MEHRRSFGSVLKRYRLAAGLTQEALAERAGLGARTISDLERGVSHAPRSDTLVLLIDALNLSPEQQAVLKNAARQHTAKSLGDHELARNAGSLPAPLTSFFGRENEAHELKNALDRDDTRLVTLTGPGGVGKTRLAIYVMAQVCDSFVDGVSTVALDSVVDREGIIKATARALGTVVEGSVSMESLVAALSDREFLLVLDNFEHLLDSAPLVAELLRDCPKVKVLATSRAPLRVSGEQEFPVTPLPVPDQVALPPVEALAENAAVALLVDRATRVRPDFALTSDNAAVVAAICARLDGLPLALELAAARLKTFSPQLLFERLGELPVGSSLRLLTGGARDAPARQQTLRAAIAWSHRLLTPEEQLLFRRLAVFAGGCTLEAAESICALPPDVLGSSDLPLTQWPAAIDVLDGLASLVDKSLVGHYEVLAGEPRFRMLETIREFARDQLAASGEEETLLRKHAEYYLAMVETTGALLFAGAQKRVRLAYEQDNVQAALRWLVKQG
jgi:predicted ATPase/DNA-binding XRE family transcriptional regulator